MNKIAEFAIKLWNYHFLNQQLKKADCIIGLGSYDLRVAGRCAELYSMNYAPFVVFSGMHGNWTKGKWQKTEAEIFADWAKQHGLPDNVIKLEKKATNLGENAFYTKQLLQELDKKIKTAIVVTKPSTQRRAYATFTKVWPEIEIVLASPELSYANQIGMYVNEVSLINEMVGDLQRIQLYPELGYQIPQEIPTDVWHAYEALVSFGYSEHLIK